MVSTTRATSCPGSQAEFDRIHDEATIGLAAQEAGQATPTAELTHLGNDTRARLLDLSNIDARFSPDVIAASVRQVVRAWEQATSTSPKSRHFDERLRDPLRALTTSQAFEQLTHPTPHSLRRVSRLEIRKIEIRALSQDREHPTVIVHVKLHGIRWLDSTIGSFLSGAPTTREPSASYGRSSSPPIRTRRGGQAMSTVPAARDPGGCTDSTAALLADLASNIRHTR